MKRSNQKAKGKKQSKKQKPAQKAEPFQWGSPGCYTKFLSECQTENNQGRNVFDSGDAKDNIAAAMNRHFPNCSREVIRQKIRQKPVQEDLDNLGIQSMFLFKH